MNELIGLVFSHFNNCSLFNAKSCFYIYIKYIIGKHILYIHTFKWSNSSIPKIQFSLSQQSLIVPSIVMYH